MIFIIGIRIVQILYGIHNIVPLVKVSNILYVDQMVLLDIFILRSNKSLLLQIM